TRNRELERSRRESHQAPSCLESLRASRLARRLNERVSHRSQPPPPIELSLSHWLFHHASNAQRKGGSIVGEFVLARSINNLNVVFRSHPDFCSNLCNRRHTLFSRMGRLNYRRRKAGAA